MARMVGIPAPRRRRPRQDDQPGFDGAKVDTGPARSPTGPAPAGPAAPAPAAGGGFGATSPPPGGHPATTGNATDLGEQVQTGQGGPTNIAGPGQTGNPMPGYTPPPPPGLDELTQQFAMQQVQAGLGPANTADREDLINANLRTNLGASLVGNRAAMGRAGMQSGGLMQAMQNDAHLRANRAALEQIFGVRDDAADRATRNAESAIRIDTDKQKAASDLADAEARRAALEALLSDAGFTSTPTDTPPTTPTSQNFDPEDGQEGSYPHGEADKQGRAPEGSDYLGSDAAGNTYLRAPDGTTYMTAAGQSGD